MAHQAIQIAATAMEEDFHPTVDAEEVVVIVLEEDHTAIETPLEMFALVTNILLSVPTMMHITVMNIPMPLIRGEMIVLNIQHTVFRTVQEEYREKHKPGEEMKPEEDAVVVETKAVISSSKLITLRTLK
jgi:hypothetical protein